jgi:uncharacterized hydrophobic protein (TIGR00271 family)
MTASSAREREPASITVALLGPQDVPVVLPVARALSRSQETVLTLLEMTRPSLDADPANGDSPDWVREAGGALEGNGVTVQVASRRGHNLQGMLQEAASELRPDLLLIGLAAHAGGPRQDELQLADLLVDMPCDIAVVTERGEARTPQRILVSGDTTSELESAAEIAAQIVSSHRDAAPITVLGVVGRSADEAELGDEADAVAAVTNTVDERGDWRVRVVRAGSHARGVLQAASPDEFDLIVLATPTGRLLHRISLGRAQRRIAERSVVPVLVVKPRLRGARSWIHRVGGALLDVVPTLNEEEKVELYRDTRRGARHTVDFTALILLAAAITSLGLLIDSAAVVIGGMLVAPLLSPIAALGLAVVHGDERLLRLSGATALRGALLSVFVGLLAGLIIPDAGLTDEVLARSEPSLLDLGIAISAGAAGAYALGRRSAAAALPGVAIAVALLPPLAVVGIALALGEEGVSARALLLFLANLVATAGAGGLIFLWLGFRPEPEHALRLRVFNRGLTALLLLALAVTIPLTWLTYDSLQDENLRDRITATLRLELDAHPGIVAHEFDLQATDDPIALTVRVETTTSFGDAELNSLDRALEGRLGREVQLTLLVQNVNVLEESADNDDGGDGDDEAAEASPAGE